jgi:hypothetical protein
MWPPTPRPTKSSPTVKARAFHQQVEVRLADGTVQKIDDE